MSSQYITETSSIYVAIDKGLQAQIAVMEMLEKNPNLRPDIREALIISNRVNASLSNELMKLVLAAREEYEHE